VRAAVVVTDATEGSLEIRHLPDPEPAPGQVVIAVRAAGLNRADLLQRAGRYGNGQRHDALVVAGMDAAGAVVAVGRGVSGLVPGDRVMAMCSGAYAELVAVDARLVLPVPSSLTWEEAAALPVALMTELDALVNAAELVGGESVLITAAGSGVGTIGVQVARALGAGLVIGTARGPASAEAAQRAGADRVLDGADVAGLPAAVLAATADEGVSIIIDHVGANLLGANLAALTLGGRLVSVGRLGGRESVIDLDTVARKRLRLIGTTFRTRTPDQRAAIAKQVKDRLLDHLAAGAIRPLVSAVYELGDVLGAQADMRKGRYPGKLVVRVG
jgi:NADPH:quinone reductase